MITERYIERDESGRILFRIAVKHAAVFDVLTDATTLERCRDLMRDHDALLGAESIRMGSFGPFDVTLSLVGKTMACLMIDGPELDNAFAGGQGAGVYVSRDEMLKALSAEEDWSSRSE